MVKFTVFTKIIVINNFDKYYSFSSRLSLLFIETHLGHFFHDSKEQQTSETMIKNKLPVRLKLTTLSVLIIMTNRASS